MSAAVPDALRHCTVKLGPKRQKVALKKIRSRWHKNARPVALFPALALGNVVDAIHPAHALGANPPRNPHCALAPASN